MNECLIIQGIKTILLNSKITTKRGCKKKTEIEWDGKSTGAEILIF